MTSLRAPEPDWSRGTLLPAVVQDAADGAVLMLAWMDAEAWAATLETGEAHFHSRSRNRLWRKGETSGNVLRVRGARVDCDRDAILLEVDPVGPACHRGTRSCFHDEVDAGATAAPGATPSTRPGFAWLDELWTTVEARVAARPEGSYTAELVGRGVDGVARKVAEEATEVVLAAKDDAALQAGGDDRSSTRAALAGEVADLLFHALVLLAERGLPPSEVIDVLRSRAVSGPPRGAATPT